MIRFDNGGVLVQKPSELPNLRAKKLVMDFETSSGDPKKMSVNPWMDCRVCGVALCEHGSNEAWYVPRPYLDLDWLLEIYLYSEEWINHNVKYDAHVGMNDLGLPFYHGTLIDTLTQAKVFDSDRTYKGGYSLETLASQLLGRDVSGFKKAMYPYLEGVKNKDYGRVPHDLMAEYACQDVFDASDLWSFLETHMHEESRSIAKTEISLTKVLLASERRGLHINRTRLKIAKLKALTRMEQIAATLKSRLGYLCNPKSNKDCEDLLIARYGLPVLKRTPRNDETGGGNNASFDKLTLAEYQHMVDAPAELVELLLEYRHYDTLNGLFWDSWLEKETDGYLHADYNQSVRSGRMSCKTPNAQQMSKDAKREIFPRKGYAFVSMDYSQIEYRMIAHYTQNAKAIKAYNEDPDTDYHTFVAELVGCKRRPAKTINFGIAFNMGKAKLIVRLKADKDLVKKEWTSAQTEARAEEILEKYYKENSSLRSTAKAMERVAKERGFVRDSHGRRLQLPDEAAWLAFNRIMQSSASSIAKECAVAVSPVNNEFTKKHDIHLVAIVHDEFLFEVPTDFVPAAVEYLRYNLEHPAVKYRIPIRVSVGVSSRSWAECVDYPHNQALTGPMSSDQA